MKKLQITSLSLEENIDLIEAKILVLMKVLARIDKANTHGFVRADIHARITTPFTQALESAERDLKILYDRDAEMTERILHRVLSLHSLEIEQCALYELFAHDEIHERVFRTMLSKVESQIARVEEWKNQIKNASERKELPDPLIRILRSVESAFTVSNTSEDRYMMTRTRQIITEKVLRRLETLRSISVLSDTRAFTSVIALYQDFHDKALEKRTHLQQEYGAYELEGKLVDAMVHKYTGEILWDFVRKGMISEKSAKILSETIHE